MKNKMIAVDPRWLLVKKKLKESKNVIDLGCGNDPVAGAKVGVDFYLEPKERIHGAGPAIDEQKFRDRGVRFVQTRVDASLPFKDKEFDFAYSHHVFEHLDDPQTACREMMRIARSGVIITPSFFSEHIFGRPYHRWLIMDRGNRLFFFRKREFEQTPFGLTPNPFDKLLNDGDWYKGQDGNMPELSNALREHWYGHSPLLEMIFIWDNAFEMEVII